MRVRKLSASGDYTFGQRLLNFFIDEPAGVAQVIQTTLLLFQGEWYLDTSTGTPFLEGVMGKHTQAQADSIIQSVVTGVQGVADYYDYQSSIDSDTRLFSVSMTVDTIYGPTPVQVQNYLNF